MAQSSPAIFRPMSELVTVPNVHLASVGRWECSTGVWECTAEQLAAIVTAAEDPGVRTPVVKLGHIDRRFDGEPSIGRIQNLRLSANGMELYGDLVGVPKWLADVMGSAFPNRSVEVYQNYVTATGNKHAAILGAVSLLGVTVPAIESLEDIRALYEGDYAEMVAAATGATRLVTTAYVQASANDAVLASVSMDAVRSEFYESLPEGSWAWVREMWSDFFIVEDSDDDLYQVPWSADDVGEITFGTPTRVQVQYVPLSGEEASEEASEDEGTIMLMGGAQRWVRLLGRFHVQDPRLVRASTPEGGHDMEMTELLAVLGLPDDASPEDVRAHVDSLAQQREAITTPPATAALPDGVVAMDEAQVSELVSAAADGREAMRILRESDRDRFIDAAITAGKFPPARREHWVTAYDADRDGTRAVIDGLAAGLIPVGDAHGHSLAADMTDDEALWAQIAPAFDVSIKEG